MKVVCRIFLVAIIVGMTVLPQGRALPRAAQQRASGAPAIMWEPADLSDWSERGVAQVHKIIDDLQAEIQKIPQKAPLTEDMIRQIAVVYGGNGILTGHDGMTYRGDREITMYFTNLLACHKVADVHIEIKFVYAMEFSERAKSIKGSETDIIHSLHFILSCNFLLDGQRIDPPSTTECPHTRMCECDRSK